MADSMDLVQQREAENLARNIAKATMRTTQISAFFCESCDAPIPEARRKAIDGVTLCVDCQTLSELKSSHYRGAAL
ncbi:TraR/DksA family transcriptional regulator [Erwiniaceae bacterium BAC15a-03b]|uniref:TraR/DksA family transcriptional regulator n=1 Tax=Winslowiella arboricola TaxID=2978220 RepID=A0A9J6PN17_9GAMM|nr:TraR/DksA family transcriptional regulator [Winslowiella arboricola]MCU5773094.1 TraR/DksA family transcriptional regulator [Winslowiella arboricola]MCU5777811.1 TraR/DksA family transcriptional regulator [Winslowiella arboricola]